MASSHLTCLFAVVDATGIHGSAVIRALLEAHPNLDGIRIRALITSRGQQLQSESLSNSSNNLNLIKHARIFPQYVDLTNVDSIVNAVQGCSSVFASTDGLYWNNNSGLNRNIMKEIQIGKNIGEACLRANVEHLVWSGFEYTSDVVENPNRSSNIDQNLDLDDVKDKLDSLPILCRTEEYGYHRIPSFDGKAIITHHLEGLGIPKLTVLNCSLLLEMFLNKDYFERLLVVSAEGGSGSLGLGLGYSGSGGGQSTLVAASGMAPTLPFHFAPLSLTESFTETCCSTSYSEDHITLFKNMFNPISLCQQVTMAGNSDNPNSNYIQDTTTYVISVPFPKHSELPYVTLKDLGRAGAFYLLHPPSEEQSQTEANNYVETFYVSSGIATITEICDSIGKHCGGRQVVHAVVPGPGNRTNSNSKSIKLNVQDMTVKSSTNIPPYTKDQEISNIFEFISCSDFVNNRRKYKAAGPKDLSLDHWVFEHRDGFIGNINNFDSNNSANGLDNYNTNGFFSNLFGYNSSSSSNTSDSDDNYIPKTPYGGGLGGKIIENRGQMRWEGEEGKEVPVFY